MDDSVSQSWEKLLNPATLRRNLMLAGLFIAAHEMLMDSLVRQVKEVFVYENGDARVEDHYRTSVLSLDPKYPLRASCLWLRDANVLGEQDVQTVDAIRRHRNELAHDLPSFLADTDRSVSLELLTSTRELLGKVDRWFAVNVHAASDPAFDGIEVDESEVTSGRMVFLQIITDATIGDRQRGLQFYGDWLRRSGRRESPKDQPSGK